MSVLIAATRGGVRHFFSSCPSCSSWLQRELSRTVKLLFECNLFQFF